MHTHTVNSSFLDKVILLSCDKRRIVRPLDQHCFTLKSTGRSPSSPGLRWSCPKSFVLKLSVVLQACCTNVRILICCHDVSQALQREGLPQFPLAHDGTPLIAQYDS